MRIKKILDSVGLVGNVLNQKSSSKKDAYSCDYVNKLNTYSEEEQVIGTYLGKPLYRKVITGNIADDTTLVSNVAVLLDAKGSGDVNMIHRVLPYYEVWDNQVYSLMVNKKYPNEVKTVIFKAGEPTTAPNCNIVLEYTKTTD